ncbi:MAG TPA: hypothetical protein VIU35_17745 [Chitinophagaceae bacterium]
MKNLSVIFLFLLISTYLEAQDSTRFVVKAGQTIQEVLKPEVLYRYPQFVYGKVYILNGQVAEAKLNYNRIIEEIQFIDLRGDTLSLADESTIRLITMNQDSFYFDDGYLELIQDYSVVKMAIRERIRLSDKQKIGAYGQTNTTTSIETTGGFLDSYKRYNVVSNENLVLQWEKYYYLSAKRGHFFIVNKKNVLKEFGDYRKALQDFLDKNDLNFKREEDLRKLCEFIVSQQNQN